MAHGIHMFLQCTNLKIIIIHNTFSIEHWKNSHFCITKRKQFFFDSFFGRSRQSFLFLAFKTFLVIEKHLEFPFYKHVFQCLSGAASCTLRSAHNSTHFFLLFFKSHWLFCMAFFFFSSLLQCFHLISHSQRVQCSLLIDHCTFVGSSELCVARLTILTTYAIKLFGPRREHCFLSCFICQFMFLFCRRFVFGFFFCILQTVDNILFFSKWNLKRISQW